MRGLQADEMTDVIRHAADFFGDGVEATDRASEKFMQAFTLRGVEERFAVFGAENDVVVQAEIGGWHVALQIWIAVFLAPLRGAVVKGIRNRWCRFAQPPANVYEPSGFNSQA